MRGRFKGMTLMELMVAMALSVVIMGGLYVIARLGLSSGESQEEVIHGFRSADAALRLMLQDIQAAGLFATPNGNMKPDGTYVDPKVCYMPVETFKPGGGAMAIWFDRPAHSPYAYISQYDRHIKPMSVTLFGAYPTTRTFFTREVTKDANGYTLVLIPSTPPLSNAQLTRIFSSNHLVRVVNTAGRFLFLRILSTEFSNDSYRITVAPPQGISPGGECDIAGLGAGLQVNVLSFIRYRVRHDPQVAQTYLKYDLVREELDPFNNGPDGKWRVVSSSLVAEYVVDLQFYDFVVDLDQSGTDPDLTIFHFSQNPLALSKSVLTGNPYVAVYLGGEVTHNPPPSPQSLRAVTIKISIANPTEERASARQGLHSQHGPGEYEPIRWFDLKPYSPGLSRVVSLADKVLLMNLVVRNVK